MVGACVAGVGACMVGACVAGGCASQRACMAGEGSMCGRGHAWQGACRRVHDGGVVHGGGHAWQIL